MTIFPAKIAMLDHGRYDPIFSILTGEIPCPLPVKSLKFQGSAAQRDELWCRDPRVPRLVDANGAGPILIHTYILTYIHT